MLQLESVTRRSALKSVALGLAALTAATLGCSPRRQKTSLSIRDWRYGLDEESLKERKAELTKLIGALSVRSELRSLYDAVDSAGHPSKVSDKEREDLKLSCAAAETVVREAMSNNNFYLIREDLRSFLMKLMEVAESVASEARFIELWKEEKRLRGKTQTTVRGDGHIAAKVAAKEATALQDMLIVDLNCLLASRKVSDMTGGDSPTMYFPQREKVQAEK